MFSARFDRNIRLTHHAMRRMAERNIDEALLLDIIETGSVKHRDTEHLWVYRNYADRSDNALCVAIHLNASALVVKTVMYHFSPEA